MSDPEKARHWRYFLLLESELDRALRIVEPDPANYDVFGLDLARQLVSISAQFEVIARLFCKERSPGAATKSINQIHVTLLTIDPKFPQAEAVVLWRTDKLYPFSGWLPNTPPTWWTAYNKVKHDPAKQLTSATLGNVLHACAAVGLLTQEYVGSNNTIHGTRVFWLEWPV